MCYVCNCFAWTLDLLQRILTFILSCWLACSVCCGISIAIVAGIAYGYNYCMAEFITLTRYDVNVHMRRGQFQDRPDLLHPRRRSNEEGDVFPFNFSDYNQQVPMDDDSLSGKWSKDQNTQIYAAKLNKYSEEKTFVDSAQQAELPENPVYHKLTTVSSRRVSYVPNRYIPTKILQNGNSKIILRQFEPMPDVNTNENVNYDNAVKTTQDEITSEATPDEEINKKFITLPPDIRIRVEDIPIGKTLKMRHWRTTAKPIIMDYSPDAEEEALVYRAI